MAIIAVTGQHPMCGLNPFPLFEDGNFMIPSAYIGIDILNELKKTTSKTEVALIKILSQNERSQSQQIIARKFYFVHIWILNIIHRGRLIMRLVF